MKIQKGRGLKKLRLFCFLASYDVKSMENSGNPMGFML